MPKFKVTDCIMPAQAKGHSVFPVFEVVAITLFNADLCYICIQKQYVNGTLHPATHAVPILVNQEELALFSIEGESKRV